MITEAVYGRPPLSVAEAGPRAVQLSPLIPGSTAIETLANGALERITVLAPPGTLERRYVLAQALRVLRPSGRLAAAAPKAKGGARLAGELAAFGVEPAVESRRHHKICTLGRPDALQGLAEAIAAGAPRQDADLGLWTQPGVFSWDRVDRGSALLLRTLPVLAGRGADLGCGVGVLARAVLASPKVTGLTLVDLDRRAVDLARLNLADPRVEVLWRDLREPLAGVVDLDFVVTNPPFHDGGAEDRALGAMFIRRAADLLVKGGVLWLVANRHLPYEAELRDAFARVDLRAEADGFKVYEARR